MRLLKIIAHTGLVNIYDEVYKDSQGREIPSVKTNVKNGNYRRKDMVGISLITTRLNFEATLPVKLLAILSVCKPLQALLSQVSQDFNLILGKYAKT